MTNPNHRRPSSVKLREELKASRAQTEKRWGGDTAVAEPPVIAEPLQAQPSGEQHISKKNYALKWIGALAATGGLTVIGIGGFNALHKNDDPVDPMKLAGDQVTRIYVQPDGSHYPGGIAAEIVNNDTDVAVVATEIQRENEGSHTVQTGVQLVLPKSQLDPKAVEAYEHDQQ